MGFLMKIFGTGADLPITGTQEEIKKKFNGLRWRVFASITIGYAFYYIIRQSYSVIKKPLLASGVVEPAQVGFIGSVFFVTYGLGKFTNSFLSDRMNNKRFFAFGLFMSSLTMTCMGLVNSFVPLAVLWGINGWFQSYEITPEQFGYARCDKSKLVGGTPAENAAITRAILRGEERGAKRQAVCLNAGAALYIGGKAASIEEGVLMAEGILDSGAALAKLEAVIRRTGA